jgi:hypothetical protein
MWIFLSDSFLSVVAHKRDQPDMLLVRARVSGDIERVFPDADVSETPTADYRFRAVLPRGEVAGALAGTVLTIDYDNFKNSVTEHDRHDAYFGCWRSMHDFQTDRARG